MGAGRSRQRGGGDRILGAHRVQPAGKRAARAAVAHAEMGAPAAEAFAKLGAVDQGAASRDRGRAGRQSGTEASYRGGVGARLSPGADRSGKGNGSGRGKVSGNVQLFT